MLYAILVVFFCLVVFIQNIIGKAFVFIVWENYKSISNKNEIVFLGSTLCMLVKSEFDYDFIDQTELTKQKNILWPCESLIFNNNEGQFSWWMCVNNCILFDWIKKSVLFVLFEKVWLISLIKGSFKNVDDLLMKLDSILSEIRLIKKHNPNVIYIYLPMYSHNKSSYSFKDYRQFIANDILLKNNKKIIWLHSLNNWITKSWRISLLSSSLTIQQIV